MRKIIERILVFCIGIPAVFSIIYFLPHYNHLAWNIIIIAFSAIGAMELADMLNKKQFGISKINAFILGSLAPLGSTLYVSLNFPLELVFLIIIAAVMWVLISLIFSRHANMDTVIHRLAGYLSVTIYPGFFMFWLVQMSIFWPGHPASAEGLYQWDNSGAIFLFFVIVFANDSLAWLAGNLFGKNNRGLIPASPNKSIAGFIGGLIGSVAVCIVAARFFQFVFPNSEINLIPPAIIIGVCTGLVATLGDLAESAIKRSCDVKDSGKIMLGRGGILDSIDSIAVAAPVYFCLFLFLFYK
jgi:phosphatidate cytidylyltransferase